MKSCSTTARKDRMTDTVNDMITTKEGDVVGMVASDQERTRSNGRKNAAAPRY
ncbi:hypothetical protein [Paenibacillus sp. ICGEB2008]|uniref:hypothetical protein n=1 Tax=Paenibacillus sp. ICGEB2008 TaxID=996640 RepID=UPI0002EE3770|nr:hypothetical protein [Paenibacillus sp. ICGEB2008]